MPTANPSRIEGIMDPYSGIPPNEHEMSHTDIYQHNHPESSGWSAGWIIGIVILIIIIILVIWWLNRNPPLAPIIPVNTNTGVIDPNSGPIWTFTQSRATSDTFLANNYTIYTASSAFNTTNLTITNSSSNPTGQQFIIDNTSGLSDIRLVGVTATPTGTVTVPRGRAHLFIWKSTGVIMLVST